MSSSTKLLRRLMGVTSHKVSRHPRKIFIVQTTYPRKVSCSTTLATLLCDGSISTGNFSREFCEIWFIRNQKMKQIWSVRQPLPKFLWYLWQIYEQGNAQTERLVSEPFLLPNVRFHYVGKNVVIIYQANPSNNAMANTTPIKAAINLHDAPLSPRTTFQCPQWLLNSSAFITSLRVKGQNKNFMSSPFI